MLLMKMSSRSVGVKVIVIVGPTTSGKSALAVRLAKKFSGEVVSGDSRQVYKGMDIGTGKIRKTEMGGIPHYLLDVASPKQKFTVTRFQKLAEKAVQNILRRKKVPIICGGTGLYLDALICDWKLPEVKPDWKLRKKLERKSTEELFRELKKLDPKRAKGIDKHNRRRLVRALEIVIQTGKSSYSNILLNVGMPKYEVLKLGVDWPDAVLKKRIQSRLLARLKSGMTEEVRRLRNSGLSWKRLDGFGLEYRWVSKFLRGEINKSEMIEKLNKEIWHYAKRQRTWFKRDKNVHWISKRGEADLIRNKGTLRALAISNGASKLVKEFLKK